MIVVNRSGRALNPIVQRSPVRKSRDFLRVGAAAVQRDGSLTGTTSRISRVHESCDCSVREMRVSAAWTWAAKTFEENTLNDTYTGKDAIALAKESDSSDLFCQSLDENRDELLGMRRGAV